MIKKLTSFGALLCLSFTAFADVSVIINKSNTNQLDKEEIVKIFLGKSQAFPDGNTVIPVNLTSSETRSEFDSNILGRSSSQINAYWSKAIFTGAGNPPKRSYLGIRVAQAGGKQSKCHRLCRFKPG